MKEKEDDDCSLPYLLWVVVAAAETVVVVRQALNVRVQRLEGIIGRAGAATAGTYFHARIQKAIQKDLYPPLALGLTLCLFVWWY